MNFDQIQFISINLQMIDGEIRNYILIVSVELKKFQKNMNSYVLFSHKTKILTNIIIPNEEFVNLWHCAIFLCRNSPKLRYTPHTIKRYTVWHFDTSAWWMCACRFGVRVLSHIRMNFTLNCHYEQKKTQAISYRMLVFACCADDCDIIVCVSVYKFYVVVVAWIFYTKATDEIQPHKRVKYQTKPVT